MSEETSRCMWDNCQSVVVPTSEIRKFIQEYAQSKLTEQQKKELVRASITCLSDGESDSLPETIKVFFVEPEFLEAAKAYERRYW